jgi:hypothetical protein
MQENQGKFQENFGEISEIPKIHEKFPGKFLRKISGKFLENWGVFLIKRNVTAQKPLVLFL